MSICERILQGTKVSNAFWVEVSTPEQATCFKDWVLFMRPESHTEFARLSSKQHTLLTWFDMKWDDHQGIIDRIGYTNEDIFSHEKCSFEDWYADAYPNCESEAVCDFSELL